MAAHQNELDQIESEVHAYIAELRVENHTRMTEDREPEHASLMEVRPSRKEAIEELRECDQRLGLVCRELERGRTLYAAGGKNLNGSALEVYRRGFDAIKKDRAKAMYLQHLIKDAIRVALKEKVTATPTGVGGLEQQVVFD